MTDPSFSLIKTINYITPDRRQSKTLILSMNVDQKPLETEFLIAICRQSGDKWQSKTMFLALFCLFDLILYVPATNFQLNRDGSSWVEPVLS